MCIGTARARTQLLINLSINQTCHSIFQTILRFLINITCGFHRVFMRATRTVHLMLNWRKLQNIKLRIMHFSSLSLKVSSPDTVLKALSVGCVHVTDQVSHPTCTHIHLLCSLGRLLFLFGVNRPFNPSAHRNYRQFA